MSENTSKILSDIGDTVAEYASRTKERLAEQGERLTQLEQHVSRGSAFGFESEQKSIGALIVEHSQCRAFLEQGQRNSGRIPVGSFFRKDAIVSAGPLFSLPQRVPQISAVFLPLRVRDLLTSTPCSSNAVEYVREVSSDNQVKPQGAGTSPQVYENVAKAESALGFQLFSEPVQTLAHWVPASRQVLDDSAALASFIDRRMSYFLKISEENQLLNGSGVGGDLVGLMSVATPYASPSPVPSGSTKVDVLRRAIGQCEDSGFSCSGIVIAPSDWTEISLIKTTGTSSSGEYIFADPHAAGTPTAWGRPLVISSKMPAGDFLVGDFSTAGCELFDRQQASVEISREHSDFFIKNMVALLCEERLALVTYQPLAFVSGSY